MGMQWTCKRTFNVQPMDIQCAVNGHARGIQWELDRQPWTVDAHAMDCQKAMQWASDGQSSGIPWACDGHALAIQLTRSGHSRAIYQAANDHS
eukprot:9462239-Lingulodinium_polyedra.AAC.1